MRPACCLHGCASLVKGCTCIAKDLYLPSAGNVLRERILADLHSLASPEPRRGTKPHKQTITLVFQRCTCRHKDPLDTKSKP